MKKVEFRDFQLQPIEAESEGRTLVGYASVFNSPSFSMTDAQGRTFIEKISPTAFNKTLQENRQIKALVNHNSDSVLGSVSSGTLKLTTDEVGLRAEVSLPDTSFAENLAESVKRRDLDAMSFGFQVVKEHTVKDGKTQTRMVDEVRLFEVSFGVPFPAYPGTIGGVSLRDIFGLEEEPQEAILEDEKHKTIQLIENEVRDTEPVEHSALPATKPSQSKVLQRWKYL